ncbi:MAG TPA: VOC family protein [Gaiellaceae bacterium]|nr:VOC family protein [Gaiellaceae bacterium]
MGIAESGTLHHACFVVHDVEKTAAAMSRSLGIGPWGIWTIEPESCTVRGRDVPFSFRIAIAAIGEANYELLAPLTGDSLYVEHLADHGEGFHHTCIAYSTHDALRAARAELAGQGRELLQSGDFGEAGEFCYFDLEETGAILELLYLKEPAPPEQTIG